MGLQLKNGDSYSSQNEKGEQNLSSVTHRPAYNYSDDEHDVFEKREGGPNFRGVSWTRAANLIVNTLVGLGVLSIPNVFHVLGFFPGILLLIVIWAIMAYGGYVFGNFFRKHPSVHSVADAGQILAGSIGREAFGTTYVLFTTMAAGSAILSISISFNAMSEHAICTMGFVGVSAVLTILFASVKTLGNVAMWIGWIGAISIVTGVFVTMVGVGVNDRPAAAPPTGPLDYQVNAINNPTWEEAFVALSNVIASFTGTCAFFPIMAEMRKPQDYNKAYLSGMTFVLLFNLVAGVVVYYYCGQYVASPALGSAGVLLKKVSYGLALPGLLATSVIFTHYSAKYFFVRVLRSTRHLQETTTVHWISWFGITAACGIFSFVIASAIPFFGSLLGLIGALFGAPLCICVPAWMQVHGDWDYLFPVSPSGKRRMGSWSTKQSLNLIFNALLFLIGILFAVIGTYSSAVSIRDQYALGQVGSAFSCDDNSNSS